MKKVSKRVEMKYTVATEMNKPNMTWCLTLSPTTCVSSHITKTDKHTVTVIQKTEFKYEIRSAAEFILI
jgi:hypothetical protein